MNVFFIGHRDFDCDKQTRQLIKDVIVENMQDNTNFYFGGYGNFDSTCLNIVYSLKKDYPSIKLYFATPYITPNYLQNVQFAYSHIDELFYPDLENVPPKFAIVKRNEYLVNISDLVIAYAKYSWGNSTKILNYAKRKGKKVINICNLI